ncbi:MAG: tripartite tricarboxylate transporter TctB family protein, partial [Roseibium sp.]
MTNRVDQLFAVFLIFFGCYVVWAGTDYGYMRGTTPGPGFFPAIVGGVIVVLSVVNLVRSLAGSERLADSMKLIDLAKIAGISLGLLGVVLLT